MKKSLRENFIELSGFANDVLLESLNPGFIMTGSLPGIFHRRPSIYIMPICMHHRILDCTDAAPETPIVCLSQSEFMEPHGNQRYISKHTCAALNPQMPYFVTARHHF